MKSLAQLLASTGHDDDDIFVARAINPVRSAPGADQGSSDQGQAKIGIIRQEGGVDYHKFNMLMNLLKNFPALDADAPDIDTDEGDSTDNDIGTGPGTGPGTPDVPGGGGGSTARDDTDVGTPPGGSGPGDTDAGDTDTNDGDSGSGDDTDVVTDLVVVSSNADETLSGGDGTDTFIFGPDGGQDIISNFDVGVDVLDLRAYGFASLEDALSHAVDDGGGLKMVIGTDIIVLNDVTFAQAADLSILFA